MEVYSLHFLLIYIERIFKKIKNPSPFTPGVLSVFFWSSETKICGGFYTAKDERWFQGRLLGEIALSY